MTVNITTMTMTVRNDEDDDDTCDYDGHKWWRRWQHRSDPSFVCSLCASAKVTSPTRLRWSFSSYLTHTHTLGGVVKVTNLKVQKL